MTEIAKQAEQVSTPERAAAKLEGWVERPPALHGIIPMEARCFRAWARLMGRKPPHLVADATIAAPALVHDLTVVTHALRDATPSGVRTPAPFAPGAD